MKIWTVTVNTESGDDYGAYAFTHKPTDQQLEAFFRQEVPCEWPEEYGEDPRPEGGPGRWGSYLHVSEPEETEVHTLG